MGLWIAACASALAAVLAITPQEGTLAFHNFSSLHEFDGTAPAYAGQIDTDALAGRLSVEATALTTGLGPRDSRLLTWCLEVARFPAIELSVTRIDGAIDGLRAGAGTGTVTLHGTLTLRDLTREVAIPAAYAWEGPNLRLKGRYDMKWTDWNLPDPSTVLSTVAPDMYVRFDVLGRPG